MGRKGNASRERERLAAREQADLLKRALDAIRVTVASAPEQLDYRQLRLVRVRAQLDRIDGMIEKENNPQHLAQLATASDKLAEQERLLAGRAAPKAEEARKPRVTASGQRDLVIEERAESRPTAPQPGAPHTM